MPLLTRMLPTERSRIKSRRALVILTLACCFADLGCKKPEEPLPIGNINKDYDRQLPPGQFALRKIDPSQYPKFGEAWYKAKGMGLRESVDRSINYLHKPSSQKYY